MKIRSLSVALLVGLAAFTVGCDSPANPTVPITGKIVFTNGSPLPEGTRLRFDPMQGDRRTASAETKSDGTFEVEHLTGAEGAEIGEYTIAVLPPAGDGQSVKFAKIVPEKYMDGAVFKVEVKEGMSPLDLKVRRLVAR